MACFDQTLSAFGQDIARCD